MRSIQTKSMLRKSGHAFGPVYNERIAFLNLGLGGIGLRAFHSYHRHHDADGQLIPQILVHIDTDPNSANYVDLACPIALDAGKLRALQADPGRFGESVSTILETYANLLSPEDVQNGSRTTRVLTQLAFCFHQQKIVMTLRTAVQQLVKHHKIDCVVPFLVSSSGGGAGSALQILLVRKFQQPSFRNLITEGLSEDLLQRPIGVVAEPFAYAMRHASTHHSKILANAFAYRIESEALERQAMAQYFYHLGFSNQHGVILSDPEQIAWVVGTSVYEYQRNWDEFGARCTDPKASGLTQRYSGRDIPENAGFNS